MNTKEILLNADWQYYSRYYHYVPKKDFQKYYTMAKRYSPSKNRYGVFNYLIQLFKTNRQMTLNKVYKPVVK